MRPTEKQIEAAMKVSETFDLFQRRNGTYHRCSLSNDEVIALSAALAVDADAVIEALRPFAEAIEKYDAHYAYETDGQPAKELDTDPVDMLGILGDMFPMATFGDFRRARTVFCALSLPPSADKGE